MKSLQEAREILAALSPLTPVHQPVGQAVSAVLAEPVHARIPLPHVHTSAMDGWALSAQVHNTDEAGSQWQVRRQGAEHPGVELSALQPGEAVGVVTGSPVPEGTVCVLRSEHSRLEWGMLSPRSGTPDLESGRNIRAPGIEAARGDQLLDAGDRLTPVRAAMAAVAGYDTLSVHPVPRAEIITTGTEIITAGLPAPGQVRDTFTMSLPPMVTALGAQVCGVSRLDDDVAALVRRFESSSADLIITTGGTAHSRADTLRPALGESQAEILLDSVNMRPGHPVLSARLPSGALVLGLPGNPLAGFAALTLLGRPLLGALRGDPDALTTQVFTAEAGEDLPGARRGHRLLPVLRKETLLYPAGFSRPHMMRGLAHAEAFAVVPPEGAEAATTVECHPVPGQQAVGQAQPLAIPAALETGETDQADQSRQRRHDWDD